MLFHQGLSLLFDCGGLHRLAAFDPHRGLDNLGDFPVQARADLHRFLPKVIRLCGEYRGSKLYQTMLLGSLLRYPQPRSRSRHGIDTSATGAH
jgi:hypothetical protein